MVRTERAEAARIGCRDALVGRRSAHRRAAQADSLHHQHRAHADHVGGNEKLRNAGRTFTGGNVAGDIRDSGEGAAILAHENVLIRLGHAAEGQPAPPADALPTDTYFIDYYKLSHFFNGEGVQLIHMPKAHTDGDSIVYFRGTDVIALGDLMATDSYPVIDVEKGGSINGIIDGLNAVLDLAIPEFRLEGGTMMVPGHGRIVDSGDVAYYRDMVTIIRDRVQDMVKKGMTLDEVKAARPTADYDTEYGTTPGWTTDMFVEAVYKSLGGGRTPPRRAAAGGRRRDDGRVSRWTRGSNEARIALLVLIVWRCAAPRWRRVAASGADARARCADRSHGPVGVARHRRLALAHGDAAQGRRALSAGERGGPADGGGVGSGAGCGLGRGLPRLRRRRHHAPAGPAPHLVGERHHAEARNRHRPADASLLLRQRPSLPARPRCRASRSPRGSCLVAAGARPGPGRRVRGPARRCVWPPRACSWATTAGTACHTGRTRTMTEWFTTLTEPDGNTYLLVTKILEDPQYLNAPYVRTVQFKKETGANGWNPTPCRRAESDVNYGGNRHATLSIR